MSLSPNRPTLAVLLHERDDLFSRKCTILSAVLEVLSQRGYQIQITRGCRDVVNADLAFSHLDVSLISNTYKEYLSRYPQVVNMNITDIRKRSISCLLVNRSSSYEGPVIVKTDNNCGGRPDFKSLSFLSKRKRRIARKFVRLLPQAWQLRWVREMDSTQYPIYESVREVPRGVFLNQALIVEKFLPEREGNFYCTRTHIFLGDRSHDYLMKSPHQITKGFSLSERSRVEPHPDLELWKKERGMEYGKLEYVVIDNRAVILDVNTTPTYGAFGNPETDLKIDRLAQDLADGIDSILKARNF